MHLSFEPHSVYPINKSPRTKMAAGQRKGTKARPAAARMPVAIRNTPVMR